MQLLFLQHNSSYTHTHAHTQAVVRALLQRDVFTDDEARDVVEEMDSQFSSDDSRPWRDSPRYSFLEERLEEEEACEAMRGKRPQDFLVEVAEDVHHDLRKETFLVSKPVLVYPAFVALD